MADLQEGFWENLLDYIADRTVIPVIGSELVTVREDDREVPLYRWIASRLADDLGLPAVELPRDFGLNDVVSMHLRHRGEREVLYAQIHRILRNAALTPSESLRTLAGISGLDLFVSLTFDSLLADALGGAQQISYSPSSVHDLPCPKAELRQPVVFHLLGRASASPDYAICDDDVLEFLHAMQVRARQPMALFEELHSSHLLILGCSFGDWFWRSFLRTARGLELSQRRHHWTVLVGGEIAQDAKLAEFLMTFSPDTRLVQSAAPQFVAELGARWHAAGRTTEPAMREGGTGGREIPYGAIFLSYASADLEAASRLAEGLRSAGLEAWFDKDALQRGEDWARRIRRGLEHCSLFLPVISRQSLSDENRRGYFWREWNDADDFARRMAPGETFIVPVVIDDTSIYRAALPDSFKQAHSTSLPEGNVTPAVAEKLVELVRNFHRRRRAGDAESHTAISVKSGVDRKREGPDRAAASVKAPRSTRAEGKSKETAVQADRAPAVKQARSTNLPEGNVTPAVAEKLMERGRDFHRRRRAGDAESPTAIAVKSGVDRKREGPDRAAASVKAPRSTRAEGKSKETAVQVDRAPAAPVRTGLPPSYSGQDDYFFISYKREDTARLKDILHKLVEWGHRIWYDKGIPGGVKWPAMIESRLKNCKLLIFFASRAAIDSENVQMEVNYARSLKKTVVAVRLEEVELKHGLAMLLGSHQMIDGTADDHLEQLREAVDFNLRNQPTNG